MSGARGSETHVKIEFQDQPGLTRLVIINFLLTIITFGIYSFWAKTEVRKHIWSSVHINDKPLEYTGRGMELFLGAIIVALLSALLACVLPDWEFSPE